jgi:hypothetical protein
MEWTNLILGTYLAVAAFMFAAIPAAAWNAGISPALHERPMFPP